MIRHGMMLSALNKQMFRKFRNMFYDRLGIVKDPGVTIHALGKIVTYEKRGWAFDQRLGDGFKMVFQHYCLKADKGEYGKYDHVIYIDVEPERSSIIDETQQEVYDAKKAVAAEVTKEIEAYLVAKGLAIEIQVEGFDSPKQRSTIPPF